MNWIIKFPQYQFRSSSILRIRKLRGLLSDQKFWFGSKLGKELNGNNFSFITLHIEARECRLQEDSRRTPGPGTVRRIRRTLEASLVSFEVYSPLVLL